MEEFKKYFRKIKHNRKARIGVGVLFVTTILVLIPIKLQDDNTSRNKNITSNSNYETSSMSPGDIETITIESSTNTLSKNENKIESSTISQNQNEAESKSENNTSDKIEETINLSNTNSNNNIKENNVEDNNTISNISNSTNNSTNDTTNNKVESSNNTNKEEVVVGIDNKITSILYNYVCESTSTYNGAKSGELKSITRKVALGEISESNAKATIESMKWKENANSIDVNYENGVKDISTYEVNCTKTVVPGNMTGEQIAQNYNFNLGQFSDIIAFRNSDNSITVTSVSCSLLISSVNVE